MELLKLLLLLLLAASSAPVVIGEQRRHLAVGASAAASSPSPTGAPPPSPPTSPTPATASAGLSRTSASPSTPTDFVRTSSPSTPTGRVRSTAASSPSAPSTRASSPAGPRASSSPNSSAPPGSKHSSSSPVPSASPPTSSPTKGSKATLLRPRLVLQKHGALFGRASASSCEALELARGVVNGCERELTLPSASCCASLFAITSRGRPCLCAVRNEAYFAFSSIGNMGELAALYRKCNGDDQLTFVLDIVNSCSPQPPPPPPAAGFADPAPPPRSHSWLGWILAVLFLSAAAGLVFILRRHREAFLRRPVVGPAGIIGMTSIQIDEGDDEWVGLMARHNMALAVPPPAARPVPMFPIMDNADAPSAVPGPDARAEQTDPPGSGSPSSPAPGRPTRDRKPNSRVTGPQWVQ